MILVDTSIWVAHLRMAEPRLTELLEEGEVLVHPFVLGELACGTLRRRQEVLSYLGQLDSAPLAGNEEARQLIEVRRLRGRGLGWVDIHLLASCLIARVSLWSLDRRLTRVADTLGIAA
ncbi:MAG TPA: PIN domain-containing protein [Gemmatimonadales bacterium]|nr:PIN domain-containing protein [Gemmatimonadales bacterium]